MSDSIGLEYILQVYNMKKVKLAEQLKVPTPNVFAWLKRQRNIPKQRLDRLCEMFPKIPREYFQKELSYVEELKIRKIYLEETNIYEVVEIPETDNEGNEYIANYITSDNVYEISELSNEIDEQIIFGRIRGLIAQDNYEMELNSKMISDFLEIMESDNKKKKVFLQMVFLCFGKQPTPTWRGSKHQYYDAAQKDTDQLKEFKQFLKNNKIHE